jgi:hypothetical protein
MLTGTAAAAAACIGRGLAVFPLIPSGRYPAREDWRAHTVTDPHGLAAWPAGANIGIGCRASDVVVLDLDLPEGPGVFTWWTARYRDPADTLIVATPSGGRHVYYRAPHGAVVPSSSGGVTRLGPDVDVRAPGRRHGGYVIGPGSSVGGRWYVPVRDRPIAPAPVWLLPLLRRRTSRSVAWRNGHGADSGAGTAG